MLTKELARRNAVVTPAESIGSLSVTNSQASEELARLHSATEKVQSVTPTRTLFTATEVKAQSAERFGSNRAPDDADEDY